MRFSPFLAGAGLLTLGIALIALSIARGEGELYIFLIFPVIRGSGGLAFAGTLCIMLSIGPLISPLINWHANRGGSKVARGRKWQRRSGRGSSSAEIGGLVLIGPIPIVFGSRPGIALIAAIIGIIALAVMLAFIFMTQG